MSIKVMKFGGSSLSDDYKMGLAAKKVIDFINKGEKVVVIVSAHGDTTDSLLEQINRISKNPSKRELDVLVSTGEQISCSKFAILLQEMGYQAVSLL